MNELLCSTKIFHEKRNNFNKFYRIWINKIERQILNENIETIIVFFAIYLSA